MTGATEQVEQLDDRDEVEVSPATESRADTISKLLDADEAAQTAAAQPAPAETPTKPEEAPAVADKPTEEKPKPVEAKPETPAEPQPEAQQDKPANIKTEKAPQSWTPQAREKWATLPGDVRSEIIKRERDHKRFIDETAEARKLADTYKAKVEPYEPMIRAEGYEPMAVVENLLQTAQALRTAPVAHKAAIVANIIQSHGIAPELVAQALQGKPPQGQQQQQSVEPQVIERRVMEKLRQEQQQQELARQEQEIQSFASSHEFFDDVAAMLPGLAQAKRDAGLPVSLEAVYNEACQLHPDVSATLKQRESAARQTNANVASTQRAIAASASVKGGPAGGPRRQAAPMSRLEAIDAELEKYL